MTHAHVGYPGLFYLAHPCSTKEYKLAIDWLSDSVTMQVAQLRKVNLGHVQHYHSLSSLFSLATA
jgi:hypothetical protein